MQALNRVLLATSSFAEKDRLPLEKLLAHHCEVILNPYKRKLAKEELLNLLSDGVTGIIAGLEVLDREAMERSNLKVISRCGSGLSNVDIQAAQSLGIQVFSTPSGPINAVAELTMGCLLSLLRQICQMDRAMHDRKWDKSIGFELRDRCVAVVGFGRIGRRVGNLIEAFGAKVLAVDPAFTATTEAFTLMTLQEALPLADVVILHASGEDTIIGGAEFARMKRGSYILNAARGGLIDEGALLAALESGIIAGAWLDTFTEEPYSGPLCDFPQVMLTSHIGSYTLECRRKMEMEAVDNLLRGLQVG